MKISMLEYLLIGFLMFGLMAIMTDISEGQGIMLRRAARMATGHAVNQATKNIPAPYRGVTRAAINQQIAATGQRFVQSQAGMHLPGRVPTPALRPTVPQYQPQYPDPQRYQEQPYAETSASEMTPRRQQFETRYEGSIWYLQYDGLWYRERGTVTPADDYFFLNYESTAPAVMRLLRDAGYDGRPATDDRQVWEKTRQVWDFLRTNARAQRPDERVNLRDDGWPSIEEHAAFYQRTGDVAWAACFSKAHLFANLLGRMGIPRDRILVATAHHTEGGAPPTASHVFVLLYVGDRWYYLDPTACYAQSMPTFERRRSIGTLASVDYRHPFQVLQLPGAAGGAVPMIEDLRTLAPVSTIRSTYEGWR